MKALRRTDQDIREAVLSAQSLAHALRLLGLVPSGGNYISLHQRVRELDLSTKHWTGRGHLKGRNNPHVRKIPLDVILVRSSSYRGSTSLLKKRIIENRLLEPICAGCGIARWLDLPLVLHLDHINGTRTDNRLINLRLLCPNCHSQTPTYCGRNKGKERLLKRAVQ